MANKQCAANIRVFLAFSRTSSINLLHMVKYEANNKILLDYCIKRNFEIWRNSHKYEL